MLITLFGLLCYAVSRFAIDGYLSTFHVTSHDVGLSYGEMLAPVALLGVSVAASWLLVQVLWRSIAVLVKPELNRLAKRLSRGLRTLTSVVDLLATLITLVVFVVGQRLLEKLLGDDEFATVLSKTVQAISVSSVVIAAIGFIFNDLLRKGIRHRFKPVDQNSLRLAMRVLFWILVFVQLFFVAHEVGVTKATHAARGEMVELRIFGVLVPGIEAHPGRVDLAVGGSPGTGQCLVRLGSADGFAVFYDPRARTTVRYPIEQIQVTDLPQGERCE